MKRIRDTERPPPPTRETVPVMVEGSGAVHLAARVSPPNFVEGRTICGRPVGALIACGPAGISCPRCVAGARHAAA